MDQSSIRLREWRKRDFVLVVFFSLFLHPPPPPYLFFFALASFHVRDLHKLGWWSKMREFSYKRKKNDDGREKNEGGNNKSKQTT